MHNVIQITNLLMGIHIAVSIDLLPLGQDQDQDSYW